MNSKTYAQKKIDALHLEKHLQEQTENLIVSLKEELSKQEAINALVLFGSLARGDYSLRHSDVDLMIFLDKVKENPALEQEIRKKIIELNLGKGLKVHPLFQYKLIKEEDRSLMLTIAREGKVLFAKKTLIISQNVLGLKSYYLLKLETAQIKPVIKNKLQRFLHGYSVQGKKYNGIIDEEKFFSAGKGAILVPEEELEKILLFVEKLGVKVNQKGRFYR